MSLIEWLESWPGIVWSLAICAQIGGIAFQVWHARHHHRRIRHIVHKETDDSAAFFIGLGMLYERKRMLNFMEHTDALMVNARTGKILGLDPDA